MFIYVCAKICKNHEIFLNPPFFVSLHVDMKSFVKTFMAALLVVWYSLSVIGFDVHTCSGSGEVFIATVASGFSCEDIHPEHSHKTCGCCHSHDENHDKMTKKPCCSDDYQVILLTGVRSDEQSGKNYCSEFSSKALFADECSCNNHLIQPISGLRAFYKPRSECMMVRNVQASYSIWRI